MTQMTRRADLKHKSLSGTAVREETHPMDEDYIRAFEYGLPRLQEKALESID